jgi:hypothetical protein
MAAAANAIAGAGLAVSAHAAPAGPRSPVTRNFSLAPMPHGQLTVSMTDVRLAAYGFTPGSRHEVAVSLAGSLIPLGTLTATAGGALTWSGSISSLLQALQQQGIQPPSAGGSPPRIRVVVLNGGAGTPVIAQTGTITGVGTYALHAVEPGQGVINPGTASISYDPAARTLSVTVDASGLTPGAHAAHIHSGSCQQQGSVVYALADFTASSQGAIAHETRTVTGVNVMKFGHGWYFNLHQGSASTITAGGQPTISFRPLLCSDI